ncbi:uncharacterized protein LOC144444801 [Glandiceps talaboti]
MGSLFSKEETPQQKFRIRDGITLFDFGPSPCARRVRMTLMEKNKAWESVEVNLLYAEQKTPEFLKINPNGKVPAITIHNEEGIPDCMLYEANVITEYLDTMLPGIELYPKDPWEKAQIRYWQEWELSLTDDFVPYMYHNVFGFTFRAIHSSPERLLKDKKAPQLMYEFFKQLYSGTFQTEELMEQRAIAVYKNLLILEKALKENDQFLVGNRFTIADLSVFPRVHMFNLTGLPVTKKYFPNICRYFDNLDRRPCFGKSEDSTSRNMRLLMTHIPSVIVTIGNWRSWGSHKRFDGLRVLDRVFAEDKESETEEEVAEIPPSKEFLIADFPHIADCLQMKMVLKAKGVSFATKSCDFLDAIGRPNGSNGLFWLRHEDKLVKYSRNILEYIDNVTAGKSLYPEDSLLKAYCHCWQAWDQTMNWLELSILVEKCMISQKLHERYTVDNIDELLALKKDPKYFPKFTYIMQLYMSRVTEDSPVYHRLSEYTHLMKSAEVQEKVKGLVREMINNRLEYLEGELKDKTYLVCDDLTIADITVFSHLLAMPLAGIQLTKETHPNITAWMNTIKQLDSFKDDIEDFENTVSKYSEMSLCQGTSTGN